MEGLAPPVPRTQQVARRRGRAAEAPARPASAPPETQATEGLQAHLGNAGLAEAVRGEAPATPIGVLATEALVDASVGVSPGGAGLLASSNAARVLAMRRATAATGGGLGAPQLVARAELRGGRPLPAALQARLEAALGVSLAAVEIHTDAAAAEAADAIRAAAFTIGTDIYFSRGAYRPGTPGGDELIAHESTHVAQHLEGRSGRPSAVEDGVAVTLPGDAVEREAYAIGAAFARGAIGREAAPSPEGATEAGARDATQPVPAAEAAPVVEAAPVAETAAVVEAAPTAEAIARDGEPTRPGRPSAPGTGPDAGDQDTPTPEPTPTPEVAPTLPTTTESDTGVPAPSPDAPEVEGRSGPAPTVALPTEQAVPVNTSPGPGLATATAPAPGGACREADGLVDYYMETHWDRALAYDPAIARFGLDEAGMGTALDNFLPAEMSSGVRGALNLATAFTSGILDAMVIGGLKAIPGVGSILHVALGIRDIWTAVDTYGKLDDGWGMAINVIRGVADMVGSVVGNIGDLATAVEDLTAATGVGLPIAGVVAFFATIGRTVSAACDGIKLGCSTVSTVRNVMMANEAERRGDFRRAAKYRELASGDAVNVVVDGISAAVSIGSALSANTLPAEGVEDIAEAGGTTLRELARGKALDGLLGNDANGAKVAGEWISRTGGMQGPLGLIASATNLRVRMGLGDAMSLSPDGLLGGHTIEPTGGGTDTIGAARQQTIEQFQAAWSELEGAPPDWAQKVINDIVNPEGPSALDIYTGVLSPTTWIRTALAGIRGAGHLVENVSSGGLSAVLRGLGSGLTSLVRPALDQLNAWVRENKPAVDAVLQNLSESISRQRISLGFLRESTASVDDFLTQIAAIADHGGGIDTFVESVLARIDGLRVTPESLGIPDWLPEVTYGWALRAWNAVIGRVVGGVESLRASALPAVDRFVEEHTAWAQAQLAEIQAAIAEGGEVEQMLQGAYDSVAAGLARFVETFANWDAQVDIDVEGAAAWLTETAGQVDAAAFDARVERFKQFLTGEAQGQVDAWRADHGDAVEQSYWPEVPDHEVEALETVYGEMRGRLERMLDGPAAEVASRYLDRAERGYSRARAAIGERGEAAIESFWEGAEEVRFVAGITRS